MARFLGTTNTRLGMDPKSPFKVAKVYNTPGCYTLDIPPTATSAKVYVVGAGSSYCAGRYCATSTNCWSGVDFPICDYSFDFCGHLTGAGGGYAEKTYNDSVSGASVNITVAGPSFTTNAAFTSSSNTVYVVGEVANSVSIGSSVTSSYVNGTVTNVSFSSASTKANTTIDSSSMSVTSNSGIYVGSRVTGSGIAEETYVTTISGTTITLSNAARETLSNTNFVFSTGIVTLSGTANGTSYSSLNITGLSTSSVSGGLSTVSASSGTNLPLNYTCQGNSTARNGSLDNPTNLGFKLPVCGYTQCYNGWYNVAGTGSGGDLNRSGGTGVLIPEFVGSNPSCFDTNKPGCVYAAISATATASGATTTGYGCWLNPTQQCWCAQSYMATFGGQYQECCFTCVGCSCLCYYLCCGVVNCFPSGTTTPGCCVNTCTACASNRTNYKFISNKSVTQSDVSLGAEPTASPDIALQNRPYGIGASSGSSDAAGTRGHEPGTSFSTNIPVCAVGTSNNCSLTLSACACVAGGTNPVGSSCLFTSTQYQTAYDYSFGGTWYFCHCWAYYPGCLSGTSSCGLPQNCYSVCCTYFYGATAYYICYSPNFGTARNACLIMPLVYSNQAGGAAPSCTNYCCYNCSYADVNKCVGLYYNNEITKNVKNDHKQLILSGLRDPNGNNVNDVDYSTGASGLPATFGGGGNRLYPAGGGGLVVVLYN